MSTSPPPRLRPGEDFRLLAPLGVTTVKDCVAVGFLGIVPPGASFFIAIWTPSDGGYWFNPRVSQVDEQLWSAVATFGNNAFGIGEDFGLLIIRASDQVAHLPQKKDSAGTWFSYSPPSGSKILTRSNLHRVKGTVNDC